MHPKLEEHLVNQAMTSTPNAESEDGGPRRGDWTSGLAAAAATTESAARPALLPRLVVRMSMVFLLQSRGQAFTIGVRLNS